MTLVANALSMPNNSFLGTAVDLSGICGQVLNASAVGNDTASLNGM
jgi:hypothetical protein